MLQKKQHQTKQERRRRRRRIVILYPFPTSTHCSTISSRLKLLLVYIILLLLSLSSFAASLVEAIQLPLLRTTNNNNNNSMTTKTASRIRGGGGGKGDEGISDVNDDNDDDIVVVTPESSTPDGYPAAVTDTVAAAAAVTTATKPTLIENDTKINEENGGREKIMKMKEPFSWTQLRRTLFPIYGDEVTKFLLISSIKFFIIMVLTFTRDTKDTLIVTQCGAEAIAFLKIYGVLPAATAFIALYSKMSDSLGKKTLFYTTCIPFFIFFILFDVLIYPNADRLHPTLSSVEAFLGTTSSSGSGSGGGLAVLANIVTHWTSALFYVVAEIYSSVSVGLLFWQFANDVVPVDQAKRFYPLFAQMSGLGAVLAGQYSVRFASQADTFAGSLHRLTIAITFAGCMICFFYNACTNHIKRNEGEVVQISNSSTTTPVEGDDNAVDKAKMVTKKKKKPKMSMVESIKFLASSQYLRLIASLVLGYGLSINFTEVMWKSLVKKQYPNPLEYQRFMGNFSSAVGVSTCIVIFFGVHVIRILGWKVGAMATPAIMAIISIPFFACIFIGLDSPARLHMAVILGTIQSLLSKTSKYALFDPTTQMSYIPLDQESKVKGKAAIDVLGSRIGKSGGSFIQQILVFSFGNIINAAPVVATIYYSILFAWLSAAKKLSSLFVAQTEMARAEKLKKE